MIICNYKVITEVIIMLTDVVRIGNSKGIRIPSYILKECNIYDKVEMEIVDGKIVILPLKKLRENWSEKFAEMHKNGDDELLIDENVDVDLGDWEWK